MGHQNSPAEKIHAIIDYDDLYVQPLIARALQAKFAPQSYLVEPRLPSESLVPILQFRDYEAIDFVASFKTPSKHLVNAYIIRKALIRKHYLNNTISTWLAKHKHCNLRYHYSLGVDFELDYAEFLDDALVEAFELRESFERNREKQLEAREWWILKPGMSDRGQGIRIFSTEEELRAIFEQWEADLSSSDEDENEQALADTAASIEPSIIKVDVTPAMNINGQDKDYIITSQLRHFIAQPYLHPPLLLPSSGSRKFHIRTYVLAVGALKVYIYKPMLALFAREPYAPPWAGVDLNAHLTNTCHQGTGVREGSVRAFWSLENDVPDSKFQSSDDGRNWKDNVWEQICAVTAETFEAAARGQVVHFQPLPNAFELFGLDFLVDGKGMAWLLEVNAFPDFQQTGEDLKAVVQGLFEEVVDVAIKPFFGLEGGKAEGTSRMIKVLNLDLGRR